MKVFLSLFISLKSKNCFPRESEDSAPEPLKRGWDGGGDGRGGISARSSPRHKHRRSQNADKRPEPPQARGALRVGAVLGRGVWVGACAARGGSGQEQPLTLTPGWAHPAPPGTNLES